MEKGVEGGGAGSRGKGRVMEEDRRGGRRVTEGGMERKGRRLMEEEGKGGGKGRGSKDSSEKGKE